MVKLAKRTVFGSRFDARFFAQMVVPKQVAWRGHPDGPERYFLARIASNDFIVSEIRSFFTKGVRRKRSTTALKVAGSS